jgi:N-dimethylarginine dimethylaminohydrolase
MLDVYFMSPPSPGWAIRGRANFRSREAEPVDAARARAEWLTLALAIEEHGGTVVALVHDDDTLTGMPYAAECGHVVGGPEGPTFVLPRMAAPHRARERERWQPFVERLGLRTVDPGEGTWEAQGDVATFDGATLLFYGGRTDLAGMRAARRCFPAEAEILELSIREPAFHGNMALLPLARGRSPARVPRGDRSPRASRPWSRASASGASSSSPKTRSARTRPTGCPWATRCSRPTSCPSGCSRSCRASA